MTIEKLLKFIEKELRDIKPMAECGFKSGFIDALRTIKKYIKEQYEK